MSHEVVPTTLGILMVFPGVETQRTIEVLAMVRGTEPYASIARHSSYVFFGAPFGLLYFQHTFHLLQGKIVCFAWRSLMGIKEEKSKPCFEIIGFWGRKCNTKRQAKIGDFPLCSLMDIKEEKSRKTPF